MRAVDHVVDKMFAQEKGRAEGAQDLARYLLDRMPCSCTLSAAPDGDGTSPEHQWNCNITRIRRMLSDYFEEHNLPTSDLGLGATEGDE